MKPSAEATSATEICSSEGEAKKPVWRWYVSNARYLDSRRRAAEAANRTNFYDGERPVYRPGRDPRPSWLGWSRAPKRSAAGASRARR